MQPRTVHAEPDWTSGPARQAAAIVLALAGLIAIGASWPSFSAEQSNSRAAGHATATINLNTANASELESLPGIGPALAKRIIEHRGTKGPFTTIESLDKVHGIGPATIERLRPFISAR